MKEKLILIKSGKLIISSSQNEDIRLKALKKNASLNGVNLKYLNKKETINIESEIECFSSLLSENTGILDSHELMLNFISDIERDGGTILYQNEVSFIDIKNNFIQFSLNNKKKNIKQKF